MKKALCISNSTQQHKKKETEKKIQAVTMILPVRGWLGIRKYDDKRGISITNLVETMWFTTYHRPMRERMKKYWNLLVMSSKNLI